MGVSEMSLKDVVDKLKDAVGDLSSLTVETYTGSITADIQGNVDTDISVGGAF